MIKIAEQFLKVKMEAELLGRRELFKREHRDLLEWYVLGVVCDLLANNKRDHPVFAVKQEAPDFLTYKEDGKAEWAEIEITEVLRPGRQRNKEMLVETPSNYLAPVAPPVEAPFDGLRESLKGKATKPYAARSILFVYFNVSDWDLSYEDDPFVPMIQGEAEAGGFPDVVKFRRVLVLDSTLKHLVELTRI